MGHEPPDEAWAAAVLELTEDPVAPRPLEAADVLAEVDVDVDEVVPVVVAVVADVVVASAVTTDVAPS
jgi:formylmethanofuran dehydrogenase subunit B